MFNYFPLQYDYIVEQLLQSFFTVLIVRELRIYQNFIRGLINVIKGELKRLRSRSTARV